MNLERGKIYLVGAGPGDPGLLTVRAAELIAQADDIVVDALVPPQIYRDAGARIIFVGKRAGRPSVAQHEIESILIELARSGRAVVRLKGGDPSVFGRAAEEMRALDEAGIEYEIIPGVSSALAAPLAVGVAVTQRHVADRVVILSGHSAETGIDGARLPAYDPRQTVVLLMGLANLSSVVAEALRRGYPETLPAVAVSRASLEKQRFVARPLGELAEAVVESSLEAPATVVIGQVARRALASSIADAESWRLRAERFGGQ